MGPITAEEKSLALSYPDSDAGSDDGGGGFGYDFGEDEDASTQGQGQGHFVSSSKGGSGKTWAATAGVGTVAKKATALTDASQALAAPPVPASAPEEIDLLNFDVEEKQEASSLIVFEVESGDSQTSNSSASAASTNPFASNFDYIVLGRV